jgi:hypothetical protein
VVSTEELLLQSLDNLSGFILSLIDGSTSIEQLFDLSGVAAEETLAILEDLRRRGIITYA